jgi:hypothetical protein
MSRCCLRAITASSVEADVKSAASICSICSCAKDRSALSIKEMGRFRVTLNRRRSTVEDEERERERERKRRIERKSFASFLSIFFSWNVRTFAER